MIGIERRFSDDTRLIDLTVRDLKELITSLISKIKQIEEKRYVYGYRDWPIYYTAQSDMLQK